MINYVYHNLYLLSFLYQNFTDLILLMVCRSIRSHTSVTPDRAVCKQALIFWLKFPSTVLLGQKGYGPDGNWPTWIGLLSASVSPGSTNCTVKINVFSFGYKTRIGNLNELGMNVSTSVSIHKHENITQILFLITKRELQTINVLF